MPYCPQCNSEYRDGFKTCADCGVPLAEGKPPEKPPEPEPASYEAMRKTFLAETHDNIQTEMLVDILNQEGIPAFVQERGTDSYLNVYMGYPASGGNVFVDAGDYEEASKLIDGVSFMSSEEAAEDGEAPPKPWWKQKQYVFWIAVSVALIVGFIILGIWFAE